MWLIVTLVMATSAIVFISQRAFTFLPSYFYQTIVLLLLGTVGVYFYLADIKKHRSDYFVPLYIATLFAKLLAYGGYMLFVVMDDKLNAPNNALIFMITYLIFTALETFFLYRKVNG